MEFQSQPQLRFHRRGIPTPVLFMVPSLGEGISALTLSTVSSLEGKAAAGEGGGGGQGNRGKVHLRPQIPFQPLTGAAWSCSRLLSRPRHPYSRGGEPGPVPDPTLNPEGRAVQPQIRPVRPHAAAWSRAAAAGGGSATRGMSGALRGERNGSARPGERGQPAPILGRGTFLLSKGTKKCLQTPRNGSKDRSGRATRARCGRLGVPLLLSAPLLTALSRWKLFYPPSLRSPGGVMGLSTAFPRPQLSGCPLPIHRGFSSSAVSLGVFSFSLLPSHLSFWKPFNSFRHFLKHLRAAALGAWRWRWEWGREGALGAKHLSAVSPSVFLSPLLAKRVWRAAAFLCEQRRGCCPERRSDGTAAGRLPQFLIYALVNGAVPCGPQPAGCGVRREASIHPFFTLSIPSLGGMSCRPLLLPRRSVCCPCWGSAHALG